MGGAVTYFALGPRSLKFRLCSCGQEIWLIFYPCTLRASIHFVTYHQLIASWWVIQQRINDDESTLSIWAIILVYCWCNNMQSSQVSRDLFIQWRRPPQLIVRSWHKFCIMFSLMTFVMLEGKELVGHHQSIILSNLESNQNNLNVYSQGQQIWECGN